ncbi:PREDICTED: uncharacterized protein LOC109476266 [Branchiostoma belcheri]|uniref:Uncharacterized protein LOC109476266 n=1 Tax=Branchiostoma belcheri TaxID=7741 RepID=A0A6P4ZFJ3_BRABE|nr:PREDICTED: uncharacterized protein LOC109476266 [Branchiostoma belcheri]
MGGEWVNATDHEPPKNNYPNYTDIVHLSEKGNYSIRVRAANGIEPLAFSNITNVTIEDDTTLSGLLPITNWDYSEDLQTLTSHSAEQLSSAVISELNKVFNNIIGYQKSETKVDGFKEIGVTCTNAKAVMVEFHIKVAESEITSAQSVFSNSIKHERLGEFNIDKDRAHMDVMYH